MSLSIIGRSTNRRPTAGGPGIALLKGVARAVDVVQQLLARQRSRHMLATLDDRMLRDIGVDRATAAEESTRSFWQ